MSGSRPFLTARWENLVLLNYDCPAPLLQSLVPRGTELDPWEGSHLVSLVGFRFADTRVMGFAVPGHRTFEEVNLRFYVRRPAPGGGARRGVVFIRELVPKRAVEMVARRLYEEPYDTVPMGHHVALAPERGGTVEYRWIHAGVRHRIHAAVQGAAQDPAVGSEAEFVTAHYWGYGRRKDGSTVEYRVDHPRWRVWEAASAGYERPPGSTLYGTRLGAVLEARPRSAIVSPGSEVSVFRPARSGP